jgi:small subunit ribosomal protein S20
MAPAAKPATKAKCPTALKRDLQNEKRRQRNKAFKSQVKTAVRALKEAEVAKQDEKALQEKLNYVYSLMDKGVKRGVFKQNKASRTKSRLSSTLAPKA